MMWHPGLLTCNRLGFQSFQIIQHCQPGLACFFFQIEKRTSLIQLIKVGGTGDFQSNSISLLVNRVVNANKSFLVAERVSEEGHAPNRAVKALGGISLPLTPDNSWKVSDQNPFGEGELRNMSALVTQCQIFFPSWSLVYWAWCRISYCIRLCLTQTEDLCSFVKTSPKHHLESALPWNLKHNRRVR